MKISKRNAAKLVGRNILVEVGWAGICFDTVGKITAVDVSKKYCTVSISVAQSYRRGYKIPDNRPVLSLTMSARYFIFRCKVLPT